MTEPTVRNAARLVYKALHTALSPVNDTQYRELLDLYRADLGFATNVQDIADGMGLSVLDFSERGLIVVPASRDSKFAVRIADIRSSLKPEQKAALVLAHVAIASVFFPTTDGLENDNYIPPPASVGEFRDVLHALARRLKEADKNINENANESIKDLSPELIPGWDYLCALPSALPNSQRATPNSITGMVGLALSNMVSSGLARLDREATDESQVTYTATHRLRVQLRDLTLRRLFELAQTGTTTGTGA